MSVGALVAVLVFWGLAAVFAFKKESKMSLAVLPALIGAIALMVAIPPLLIKDVAVSQSVALAIGAAALAVAFAAVAFKKMPNIFLFIGMALAAWGLFRAFPHVDAAFFNFGKNMDGSINHLWLAVKGSFSAIVQLLKDLVP